MSQPEKLHTGISINVEMTRKEFDLLQLAARKDKREPGAEVRWLIESYGLGLLRYSEEGAEARSLLRATEARIRYPDSISVETIPGPGKE